MARPTYAETSEVSNNVLLRMLVSQQEPDGSPIDNEVTGSFAAPDALPVRPSGTVVHFTIPFTGTAYTAGDSLGGEVTIADAVRADGMAGRITTLTLRHSDASKAHPEGRIHIFSENPGITATDNGAITEAAADAQKECGHIDIAAADWADRGTTYTYVKKKTLAEDIFATNGRAIVLVWKTSGTQADFTSSSGVIYGTLHIDWTT